jgi:hypothetical protein
MKPKDAFAAEVRQLPGVVEGTTRFGGRTRRAWFVSGKEFAHEHAGDRLDIRGPPAEQRKLREDPRAVFRTRRSSWMEFVVRTADDVEDAVTLARVARQDRRKPGP